MRKNCVKNCHKMMLKYHFSRESLGWAHTQHFNFRHTHKTKKKLKKNKIIVYQLM